MAWKDTAWSSDVNVREPEGGSCVVEEAVKRACTFLPWRFISRREGCPCRAEPSGPQNSWCHWCQDLGKTWVKKGLGSIWENGLSGCGGISFHSLLCFFSFATHTCYIHVSPLCRCTHTFHITHFQTRLHGTLANLLQAGTEQWVVRKLLLTR